MKKQDKSATNLKPVSDAPAGHLTNKSEDKSNKPDQMDVHHPHTHSAHKKKWNEYVFEFLMLFLAVFAGFIAENIRESYVERHRIKQYVELLKRDLRVDTANINSLSIDNENLIKSYDSLVANLNRYSEKKELKSLYYYFQNSHVYFLFIHTSRAIDQLEHSGQFRLLNDIALSDTVSSYYENAKSIEEQGKIYMEYFKLYHELAFKIFDYTQFETPQGKNLIDSTRNFTLLAESPAVLKELTSKITLIRIILADYVRNMQFIQSIATTTLSYLEKKYPSEK